MNSDNDDDGLLSMDDMHIGLNMDHPFIKEVVDFQNNAPPEMVDAFLARFTRRCVYDNAMEELGSLTKYRRKLVARALVRMFRSGLRCGVFQERQRAMRASNGR